MIFRAGWALAIAVIGYFSRVVPTFAQLQAVENTSDVVIADTDDAPLSKQHVREKRSKADDLLSVRGSLVKADNSFEVVDLADSRYDATCRLLFQTPGKSAEAEKNGRCTCAFIGPRTAVAAAHCFKVAGAFSGTSINIHVIQRYNAVKGDYFKMSDANSKLKSKVVEWWFPKAYKPDMDWKRGVIKPKDPASGHDIAFMTTEKASDSKDNYVLAPPEKVMKYVGKTIEAFGYPKGYENGETAVRLTGTLHHLDGELDNQFAIQDKGMKSAMSTGASGGPWFIAESTLDEQVAKNEITPEQKAERMRWIIGVSSWVKEYHTITASPIITQTYIDIAKAFSQGKGRQYEDGPNAGFYSDRRSAKQKRGEW